MFKSDGNNLHFIGKTRGDILPVSAALYNLINKQGYKDIVLDFSKATFLDPSFMLPLVATARAYRGSNIDFQILEPEDPKSAKLLINTNWAHLITPEKYDAMDGRNRNHLSAVQYMNGDEHFSVVDRSMNVIIQSSEHLDKSRLKALEWSLNEITDNVLNHAESSIGGIVQVVNFPKRHLVEFYVCDAGIGIPKSLRSGHPEIQDDVSAVRAAIEEGVTKNRTTNQGNGLFGTFKCCEVSGGEFDILTGHVLLRYQPGSLQVSRNPIPLNGTFVRASVNCAFEGLLEKALIFRGKKHDPAGGYVERFYQTEEDKVTFVFSRELEAFGSREAGRLARNKIENIMDNKRYSIDFDFLGVHLISSSFADEVFGKMFIELGPIKFGQLCRFKNVDPTVQRLIDRSISQRMRQ